jgi:aminopeptidase N
MLRDRMGDVQFLKMLAALRSRYEFKSISTDEFRGLAKEFATGKGAAASIDSFFDNWVYSTGIPTLKVKFSVKGVAPTVNVSGTVTQTGVDDDFAGDIPVQVQFAKGAPQTIWVHASNELATFSATVRQAPVRVVIPSTVLAKR